MIGSKLANELQKIKELRLEKGILKRKTSFSSWDWYSHVFKNWKKNICARFTQVVKIANHLILIKILTLVVTDKTIYVVEEVLKSDAISVA